MNDVSLELYRVFYYVAKYSSFSRAGEKLFVSQSAVSQSIKTLEEKLGLQLFKRTTKSVTLTMDGKILFDGIKDAFELLYKGISGARIDDNSEKGTIFIASTDTLCKYFLVKKIRVFSQKFPQIKIRIVNRTSNECMDLLKNGEVDFAIVNLPNSLGKEFVTEKEYLFHDVFICAKNSPYPNKMSLKSVSSKPLMLLDKKSVTRIFLDDFFKKSNIELHPEIELQSVDILIELTKIDMGISFVPDICLKSDDDSIREIQLSQKIPPRKFGVIALKDVKTIAAAKSFINSL